MVGMIQIEQWYKMKTCYQHSVALTLASEINFPIKKYKS